MGQITKSFLRAYVRLRVCLSVCLHSCRLFRTEINVILKIDDHMYLDELLLTGLHQIWSACSYWPYEGYRGPKLPSLEIRDGGGRHLGFVSLFLYPCRQ